MQSFRRVLLVGLCLGITGPHVGWADPARGIDWVEDPYAPHVTVGSTVRLGTAVGFLYGEGAGLDVFALGATTAAGQRFGRLTLEAEFTYLTLQVKGAGPRIGDGERLGAIARFDVVRIGPRWVGGNSLACLYVEGGAAVAWNHWHQSSTAAQIQVPANTKRLEGQAGFGVLLDHRLQEPIGFPHRIGWFLGWRLALAPEANDPATVCRGSVACRSVDAMPEPASHVVNRSMLFQSSLAVTW